MKSDDVVAAERSVLAVSRALVRGGRIFSGVDTCSGESGDESED